MKSSRIPGIDLSYAIALFVIMAFSFSSVLSTSLHTIDNVSFPISVSSFSALFIFLCGMTVTIMMRGHRRSKSKLKGYLMKKGTMFLVLGVVFSLYWPVNFLVTLGLFFILSPILFQLNSSILWFVALISALISISFVAFSGMDLNPESLSMDLLSIDLLDKLWQFILVKGYFSFFPWFVFFVTGMIYGRYEFLKKRKIKKANIIASLTFILGLVLHFFTDSLFQKPMNGTDIMIFPFISEPKIVLPAFLITAHGSSVLLVNFFVYITRTLKNRKWMRILISVGNIKYSIYIMHLIAGGCLAWLFNSFVFKSRIILSVCIITMYVISIVFAYHWNKNRYKKGPLEFIIHRLAGTDGDD